MNSNYPDGSDNEDAPWNRQEPKMIECPECEGTGMFVKLYPSGRSEVKCDNCFGTGEIEQEEEVD